MPNQNNQSNSPTLGMSPGSDLPPMPPAFQNVGSPNTSGAPAESASPSTPANLPPIISSNPKKKYGGGRVIATLLGILLLVGGVGAGLILTQQQQILQPQAKQKKQCADYSTAKQRAACDSAYGLYRAGDEKYGLTSVQQTLYNAALSGENLTTYTPPADTTSKTSTGKSGVAPCAAGTACQTSGDYLSAPDPITGQQTTLSVGAINNYDPNSALPYIPNGYTLSQVLNSQAQSGSNQAGAYCPGGSCVQETDTNVAGYYVAPNGKYYPIAQTFSGGGGGGGNNPTTPTAPPSATASCGSVTAYSTNNWTLLTPAVLSSLKAGADSVYFCVSGTTTGGGFDMAKFTITAGGTPTVEPETTTKRPNSQDFCQLYNLPAGVSSYNVTATIHDSTLGWSD